MHLVLPHDAGDILLDVARRAVCGTVRAAEAPIEPEGFPAALREARSSFVTLRDGDVLRGCCGSLHAERPLVLDVWFSARAAAAADRRFAPVCPEELASLSLEVSVLSPLVALEVAEEPALIARLVPGEDGLFIRLGDVQATFLPKVWQTLPDPRQFIRELKLKAGLDEDFWSPDIEAFCYRTSVFGGPLLERETRWR